MEFRHNQLYTCSSTGELVVRDLKNIPNYWHAKVKDPISAFRIHPNQPSIIASGGKDKDLEIMDLVAVQDAAPQLNFGRGTWFSQSQEHKDVGSYSPKIKWQAKAPKTDEFGYRPQVWISDIQFLDVTRPSHLGWRIAASTRYGEINLYETGVSRRPILSVHVSTHPLVNLWFGGNEHELVYSSTHTEVGVFDSVSGSYQNLRGESGTSMQRVSIAYNNSNTDFPVNGDRVGTDSQSLYEEEEEEEDKHVASLETGPVNRSLSSARISVSRKEGTGLFLVSAGLDTYLRVYDIHKADLVYKINTNYKLTQVCLLNTDSSPQSITRNGLRRRRHDSIFGSEDDETSCSNEPSSNKRRATVAPSPGSSHHPCLP